MPFSIVFRTLHVHSVHNHEVCGVSLDAEVDVQAPWLDEDEDFTVAEPARVTPSKLLRPSPRSSRRRRASTPRRSFADAEPSAAGGFWLQDTTAAPDGDEDFAPEEASTDEDIGRQVLILHENYPECTTCHSLEC